MKTLKWIALVFIILVVVVGVYFAFFQAQPPIIKTAEITLTVKPAPDFTLTTNMSHIDTFVNRTIGFTATVASVNEFAGEIIFEVTGLPAGATISYFPAQALTLGAGETNKGIAVEIVIPDDPAIVGDYTLVVTATSTTYN